MHSFNNSVFFVETLSVFEMKLLKQSTFTVITIRVLSLSVKEILIYNNNGWLVELP